MTSKHKEMCVLCGKTFEAGPYARLCPKCLKARKKEGGMHGGVMAAERKKQNRESE